MNGGLGNQMFQYAAGRAVAIRCGATLFLDISELSGTKRSYALAPYRVAARLLNEERGEGLHRNGVFAAISNIVPRPAKSRRRPKETYRESSFEYDAKILEIRPPIYLDGYWQTEKYFNDVADAIREELTLGIPLDERNQSGLRMINAANSVSVHIRRGDYVSESHTARFHGTCSLEYYEKAMSYLSYRHANLEFFIFSDDPDWVRTSFATRFKTSILDCNDASTPHFEQTLMAACSHHIIANSSFSWWSAWLCPNPNKLVVAPEKWFNEASVDTTDLMPESWIRM